MKVIRHEKIEYIPASHEDVRDVGVWKKVLLAQNDFMQGRIQMINWAKLSVGKTFRDHYHEDMREIFIIVNGEVGAKVENENVRLIRGDCLVVEIGERHMMKNLGKMDVEFIVVGLTEIGQGKTVTAGSNEK